jgi:hypothetical protein
MMHMAEQSRRLVEQSRRHSLGLEVNEETERRIKEDMKRLSTAYEADPASVFFSLQLRTEFNQPDSVTIIDSIQKKQGVLYCRFTTLLNNAYVNGEHYTHYFLMRDMLLFVAKGYLWLIRTMVPTPDRRSKDTEWINSWFLSLAIPKW